MRFHAERAYFLQSDPSPANLDDLIESACFALLASTSEDPYLSFELGTMVYDLLDRDDVRHVLEDHPSTIINHILGTKSEWRKASYPIFVTDGPPAQEYHIDQGAVIARGIGLVPTPSFFSSSPDLKAAVGKLVPSQVEYAGKGIYRFTVGQTQWVVSEHGPIIEKCVENRWYQYVPPAALPKEWWPRVLVDAGLVWVSKEESTERARHVLIERPNGETYFTNILGQLLLPKGRSL